MKNNSFVNFNLSNKPANNNNNNNSIINANNLMTSFTKNNPNSHIADIFKTSDLDTNFDERLPNLDASSSFIRLNSNFNSGFDGGDKNLLPILSLI